MGKGEACQLWVGCMPSSVVLVHCRLHAALSETAASPPAPHHTVCDIVPGAVPSSQPHDSFAPTSSYFLLGVRGRHPALLLSHHLGLSQDLICPQCFQKFSVLFPCCGGARTPTKPSPSIHYFYHGLQKPKLKWGTSHVFLFYIFAVTVLT